MAITKRITKRKNGHANGHLASKYKSAAKKLTHAAMEAKERATDMEESVQKYAKAHPWKTMGITLLAGVVVGQLFGRK